MNHVIHALSCQEVKKTSKTSDFYLVFIDDYNK